MKTEYNKYTFIDLETEDSYCAFVDMETEDNFISRVCRLENIISRLLTCKKTEGINHEIFAAVCNILLTLLSTVKLARKIMYFVDRRILVKKRIKL